MPFRFPSFPVPFAAAALAVTVGAAGSIACTSTTTTTTTTTSDDSAGYTTALLLRPAAFIGDTPCSKADGAMRSYVANLFSTQTNRTTGETSTFMVTAPPVSCSEGVRFDQVVGGQSYWVEIDGYEELATDIGPPGWVKKDGSIDYTKLNARLASRSMVNRKGAVVTPRWAGSCGEGDQDPTIAAASGTTLITGCDPLEDLAPDSGATVIEIDPRDTLGTLACEGETADAGEQTVAQFDVESNGNLGKTLGLQCSQAIPALKIQGPKVDKLVGQAVSFYVGAHAQKDGPLSWGATCTAVVQAGLTVRAACSPLTSEATLEIDFSKILAQYSLVCGNTFATYDAQVTVGQKVYQDTGLACEEPKVYQPLQPTDYEADLSVKGQNGSTVFALACTGSLDPGRVNTIQSCTQQ